MSLKDSLPFVFALTIACRRGDGVESFLPRGERPSFAVAAVNQPARAKAAFSLIAPARSTRPTAANRITALKLFSGVSEFHTVPGTTGYAPRCEFTVWI